MDEHMIVMPGLDDMDLQMLREVASEFGWSVDVAHNLRASTKARINGKTVACLFHRDDLSTQDSWPETIWSLKRNLPDVRLIACRRFSETVGWPVLRDAGVFDALWLPMKESEVRQKFGFVWEAERRIKGAAERLPAIVPISGLSLVQRIYPYRAADLKLRPITRAAG